jgi:hypothetical protein
VIQAQDRALGLRHPLVTLGLDRRQPRLDRLQP